MDLEFCIKGTAFHGELKHAIRGIYPKLIIDEYNRFSDLVIDLINVIAIKFNFPIGDNEKIRQYQDQFRQNDYQDVKMVSRLLLPYIDDASYEKRKKITTFNEIYTNKRGDNPHLPKYEYSNVQYDRCKFINDNKFEEMTFKISDLDQSYLLAKRTIQYVSNKLFCNWINIRPLNTDNYKETELYKSTMNSLTKDNDIIDWIPDVYGSTNKIGRNYNGLTIDTFYNVISNDLYYSVRRQKWLLYDVLHKNKVVPMLIIIIHLLPTLHYTLKDYEWLEIPEDDRKIFQYGWETLTKAALETSSSVNGIGNDIVKSLVRTIMVYFNKYYPEREKIQKQFGYESFKLKEVLYDYDQDEIDNEIDNDNRKEIDIDLQLKLMKDSIETLPVQFVYSHIKNDIQQLLSSFYHENEYLFKKNEDNSKSFYKLDEYVQRFTLNFTPKNIFNISKLLCHSTKDDSWIELPRLYRGLSEENKLEFKDKLLPRGKPASQWIKLSNYIRRLHKSSWGTAQLNIWYDYIYKTYYENLADIVFNSLIKKGVLTKFVPNPELTNNRYLPKNKNKKVAFIKEKLYDQLEKDISDNWGKCYYFLTNKQYKDMDEIKLKEGKFGYFKHITKNHDWFTMFAMDWLSQILFYHHYLNNRVMFMTGATGVGKSTQVPKLFAYALKMIDYKPNGKVLVTQPRIPPTIGVSTWISKELGVPIMKFSKNKQRDIKTNNYQVQYKYQGDKHIKDGCNHPIIRFMTDGTFILNLKGNIIQKYQNKKYYKKLDRVLLESYGFDNVNDVIIVDEAHEHNTNMDLIITLSRYAANFNNNIKFVILSATIDEDEPTYRRYFRSINDNLMYPLDAFLPLRKLDRLYVDRRFHISAPGESTRFPIDEIYRPDASPDEDENGPEKIALEIIKKDSKGDILLFQPGVMEITNSINYLNEKLPANTLALPYHGQMREESRDIISKLGEPKNRLLITLSRDKISANPDSLDTHDVSPGTYTRFILVATNIAEASITIKTLKYVIDTGIQKTSIYSPELRYSSLGPAHISDSSRLQRKGRVGRQAPGVVYYTYPKGITEDIPTTFNISIEDCTDMLLSLTPEYSTEPELPLFDPPQDPNRKGYVPNPTPGTIGESVQIIMNRFYPLTNTGKLYLGSVERTIYNYPGLYYYTGFDKGTLDDANGSFYAIHPNERVLKRNIFGKIIGIDVSKNELGVIDKNIPMRILSLKIKDSWEKLQEMKLINSHYEKTQNQQFVEFVKGKFMFPTNKEAVTYAESILLGCNKKVLHLLAMIGAGNLMNRWYGITQKVIKGKLKFIKAAKEFKEIYKTKLSDLESLLWIDYKFTNGGEWKLIEKHHGGTIEIWNGYKKLFRYWMDKMYKTERSELDIPRDIPEKIYSRIYSLMLSGTMTDDNKFTSSELENLEFGPAIRNEQRNKIKTIEHKLDKWSQDNYINNRSLYSYAINLVNYLFIHNNIILTSKEYKQFIKNNTVKSEQTNPKLQDIIKSFMAGYGFQIIKKIRRTPYYVNINRVDEMGVTGLNPVSRVDLTSDSCIYPMSEILLYIGQDHNDGSVSILSNIYPITLRELRYKIKDVDEANLANKLKSAAEKLHPYLTNGVSVTYPQILGDIKRLALLKR